MLNYKVRDNGSSSFLNIASIDIGSSKILLKGAMYKAKKRFTVRICSALYDQPCLNLHEFKKTTRFIMLLSYRREELLVVKKLFYFLQEKTGRHIDRKISSGLSVSLSYTFL